MGSSNNPPAPLDVQLVKAWIFAQNPDGTFAPANLGGGGGNVNLTGVNGAPPALSHPLPVELSDGTNAFATAGNPLNDNVAQWGGAVVAAAANAAGDGTQGGPTVRPIQRKYLPLNITAIPALGATTYYGPGGASTVPATAGWFDTQQTGGHFLTLGMYVASLSGSWNTINNGLVIQGTNDTTDGNLAYNLVQSGYANLTNGLIVYTAYVGTRYWRVAATLPASGLTLTSFHLTVEEATNVPSPPVSGGGGEILTGTGVGGDGFTGSNTGWVADVYRNASGADVAAVRLFTPALAYAGAYGPVAIQRTPVAFKAAQATAAGNTALWTPTVGKKFRLMRYRIQVTGNAATTGGAVITVSFQDGTTALSAAFAHDIYIPATGGTTMQGYESPWVDMDNGYLSGAANNVLNINLSAALTAGNVRVQVCGTEE